MQKFLLFVLMITALTACGVKGELYLPDSKNMTYTEE